ncbi:MAG: cytochrome c3 family protein [Gemmatimonadota bacterium]
MPARPAASALALTLFALLGPAPLRAQQGNVAATKHNLSVSGTGTISAPAGGETEICVFCHTPHHSQPTAGPLWNRNLSAASYTPYDSPSLQSAVGQPTGPSKLCLSCHDGTIALGSVLNAHGQTQTLALENADPDGTMPSGSTLIGTNLTNDHPVSFVYDGSLASADGELAAPSTGSVGQLPLYPRSGGNVMQCTTCHDPHIDSPAKFLRMEPRDQNNGLCLNCHVKTGWSGSTHESATQSWQGMAVKDHSCLSCHAPHTEEGAERLLRGGVSGGQSAIEQTCFQCHKSSAAGGIAPDLESEFLKPYGHPITLNPGGHRPVFIQRPPSGLPENVALSPGSPAEDTRFTDTKHVECVDCHNPHRVTSSNRTEGMRGIGLDGNEVANVQTLIAPPSDNANSDQMYPVCLRCHGDTYDQVLGTTTLPSGAQPGNKRLQFQRTNSSYHPVTAPGRNRSTNLNAQLTSAGLSTDAVIECTDCHNSDAYENVQGRVPARGTTADMPVGPHGSAYPSILRAPYWNSLPGPASFSRNNFKLCFQCHDVNRLVLNDRQDKGSRTNFYQANGNDNLHLVHLDDRADKARAICKSCHYNVHSNQGAPNTIYIIDGVEYDGNPPDNFPTRLVNFHPMIAGTGGYAKPRWSYNTSNRNRTCNLRCHGTDGSYGGGVVMNETYRPETAGVDVPIN